MSNEHCLSTDLFPHEIMELILEKLPVRSLVKFKYVSRQWKSTIDSRHFQEKQLISSQSSRDPIILTMKRFRDNNGLNIQALSTSVFELSAVVYIPTPEEKVVYDVCPTSCDGLICFYNGCNSGIVVNPATGDHRSFPPLRLQQHILRGYSNIDYTLTLLGFGKDKFNCTYKPVWLYNSSELGLENTTTCEVFDFGTNSWRYVTPSSPYRIICFLDPVYVDGSLHWVTECKDMKVISLDLHTETFQVISKLPCAASEYLGDLVMCNLDNHLCASEYKATNHVIWSFDSCNKTWEVMYVIDLNIISRGFRHIMYPLLPLAVLEGKKKKNKLLYSATVRYGRNKTMMVHDPDTKSYDLVFKFDSDGCSNVSYFESLVSIS